MSRFFRGSDSESDTTTSTSSSDSSSSSSSSSSSDYSSSDEEVVVQPKRTTLAARFMGPDSSDSESDDDVKRVVRSAKDRRFDEMRTCVEKIDGARRSGDWAVVSTEFDRLTKIVSKSQNIIKQAGLPNFFVRLLVALEDHLKELQEDKDAKKKMNAGSARAMNAMRQKLRKHNKSYETEIQAYRKNPVVSGGEEASESEVSEDESDIILRRGLKKQSRGLDITAEESDQDEAIPADKTKKKQVQASEDSAVKAYTPGELFKKLNEIIVARGKKNADRQAHINVLRELFDASRTPYQKIHVLLVLIAAQFDFAPGVSGSMNVGLWKSTAQDLSTLMTILEENTNFTIYETAPEPSEDGSEQDDIRGSIISFIDRLDDEFTRSLQNMDPHVTEYVDRLKDEPLLYNLIVRAQAYLQLKNQTENVCRAMMRRLEHLYYKPDQVVSIAERAAAETLPKHILASVSYADKEPAELIRDLSVFLYKHASPMLRTRAILYHVYNHALRGSYYEARDMMLLSHLQDTISQTDINTQVLYNRALVQIGLCAFRLGMLDEAESCLQDIFATGHVKELLAQGVQRFGAGNPEQEKLERQRQLPFHMHINLELLECVYLVCAMLTEIPSMAKANNLAEARKRINSKPFRRLLDFGDRQAFVGPPENTRDYIVSASKALLNNDWQLCQKRICEIKIWDLMPESERIKEMLSKKIQEDALRTHLFANGGYYSTIYLKDLCDMFDLSEKKVQKLVARMIFEEGLQASLDQPRNLLVMRRVIPTPLQSLALALAEKVNQLTEDNERALDAKLGSEHLGSRDSQRRDQRGAGARDRGAGRNAGRANQRNRVQQNRA